MQDDITSEAAVPFTRGLYRGLAAGTPIDRAVSRSRRALAFEHPTTAPLEWAVPSLTVNGDPSTVLPPRPSAVFPEAFGDVRLADRTAEHRLFWGPESPVRLTPRVTLIEEADRVRTGGRTESDRRVGKTKLLTSCLHIWHLQGEQVCYADLNGTGNLEWLDALRRIRDALRHCLPLRSAEPIRRFNHYLAALKEGRKPEPLPPEGGETDDGGAWTPEHENELEARRRMFAEACTMLSGFAGERPLVLALDHLSRVLETDRHEYLVPGLLGPIARGELPNVALIIADRGECLDPLRKLLPLGSRRIRVDNFPVTAGLLRQYGVLFGAELDADVRREFTAEWLESIPTFVRMWPRLSAEFVDNMLASAIRG
jgi:hypothetical protein